MKETRAIEVLCAWCGALPGILCRSSRSRPHQVRVNKAMKITREVNAALRRKAKEIL